LGPSQRDEFDTADKKISLGIVNECDIILSDVLGANMEMQLMMAQLGFYYALRTSCLCRRETAAEAFGSRELSICGH
jgi:hypothetical protein